MRPVRQVCETEAKLNRLAQETGRSTSYYVKQAIEDYPEEREDYLLALAVLERDEPRRSIAEVRKDLGLDRCDYRNGREATEEAGPDVASDHCRLSGR